MQLTIRTHTIFWGVVTLLLIAIFGEVFESLALAFYFVSLMLPVAVATSFAFNTWLIPRYLFKKRYKRFGLYFFYLLVISLYLEMLIITGAFILLANYNFVHIRPVAGNITILGIILYFIVFMQGFILLLNHSFHIKTKSKSLRAEKNKFLKGYLTVWTDRRQANIQFDDICYIESMGDYIKIVTTGGDSVMTLERINHIHNALPEIFLRIHRSFIVNIQHVKSFSKTELEINGETLPINRTYKDEVNEQLTNS